MRQVTLFGIAAFFLALAAMSPADPAETRAAPPTPELEYVVVQYAQPAARAQRADGRLPTIEEEGFQRVPVPPGMTPDEYAAQLRSGPDVLSAEPTVYVYAAATPNDPFYEQNQSAYMDLIRAPEAWDLSTGAAEPVIVAVLDSGLDIRHPEFAGRLWENTRDASLDGIDDDSNGCPDDRNGCRFVNLTPTNSTGCGYSSSAPSGAILDDNGKAGSSGDSHGTLVSGIIGAAGNNATGVAGMAWDVRLMTVKVLDCGALGAPRGDMFDVARGIDYARLNGARIINLSLAGPAGDQSADTPELRRAIASAEAEGVIIVAAAGNHSPGASRVGTGYPAAYTQFANVVAVAASDSNGNWATFSNYGPAIDIAAPGVLIASTRRTDLGLEQPFGVDTAGGTSFSAPLVSGALALIMSRNAHLSMLEYVDILKSTASPALDAPHGQNWAGTGILDAGKALARVPVSLTGTALMDFKDVPAGTDVRAIIGGQECGRTTTTLVGPIARYALRVRSLAEQAGCGQPGAAVTFLVGGLQMPAPLAWGGRDQPLGFLNRDVSGVSPPPGAVVVQSLGDGWSNVAQLDSGGSLPSSLSSFASPWNVVLKWDPEGEGLIGGAWRRFVKDTPAYVNDLASLDQYEAFWIDSLRANAATPNPGPPAERDVFLKEGWNNVVYTGANRSVADALSTIAGKYSQVMQYDNVNHTWASYLPGQARYLNDLGGLFQLQTYWIFMTEAATVTMR